MDESAQLAKLQQQQQELAQKIAKEITEKVRKNQFVADSATALKNHIAKRHNDSFFLGDFNKKVTQRHLGSFTGIDYETELTKTYDEMLRSPLYGLAKTALGFSYNGKEYTSLTSLQDALHAQLGLEQSGAAMLLSQGKTTLLSDHLFALLIVEVMTEDHSKISLIVKKSQPQPDEDFSQLTWDDRWVMESISGEPLQELSPPPNRDLMYQLTDDD